MKAQIPYKKNNTLYLFSLPFTLFLLFMSFTQLQGQDFFADPVTDPYDLGITSVPFTDMPFTSLVDLDNDGDLDLFVSRVTFGTTGCWEHVSLDYYENVGTEGCPEFTFIGAQPFGLPEDVRYPTFVDIDGDGDQDLFSSTWCSSTSFFYCENIGTPEVPLFNGITGPMNPFNTNPATIEYAHARFCDMDNDGDYDIFINGRKAPSFRYQENVGSATEPQFSAPQIDPFGLQIPGDFGPDWGVPVDWDCDGDLDMLHAHSPNNSITLWDIYYYENIGSATLPEFDSPLFTGHQFNPMTIGDLDADGDPDILEHEFYYENITQNVPCVIPPMAEFDFVATGLTTEFTNESTSKSTDCRPVDWLWDFGDGNTSEEQNPVHSFAVPGIYNVCLMVDDLIGDDTICKEVQVFTSGLQDTDFEDFFTLYPNPADDFLYLNWRQEDTSEKWKIEVLNPLGQRMETYHFEFSNSGNYANRINVGNLSGGLYILKVSNKDQIFTKQFVKR